MDEGKIICCDSPRNVGTALAAAEHPMFYGLPAVMKIYARAGAGGKCPMTIRDGRLWLESILGEPEEKAYDKKDEKEKSTEYKKEKKKKTDEEYIPDNIVLHIPHKKRHTGRGNDSRHRNRIMLHRAYAPLHLKYPDSGKKSGKHRKCKRPRENKERYHHRNHDDRRYNPLFHSDTFPFYNSS